jgi:hypothetical protein
MLRRNREIVIFNLSAIDLFCSGMGAVMVLMVLLMPYYRKQTPIPPEVKPPPIAPMVVVTPPTPAKPAPPQPEPGIRVLAIDVVFVLDATGSMAQELASIRSEMKTIIGVLRRLSDEVNVGFAAYIDRAVPWTVPLESVDRHPRGEANLKKLLQGVEDVQLVGNEDWPEEVYGGLVKATSMKWPTKGDRRQCIVLIGDARAHPEDHLKSIDLVKGWVGAGKNRSLHAVFTPPLELVSEPLFQEEMKLSSDYFREISLAGKGQFHQGQDNLLGSILDILIVR